MRDTARRSALVERSKALRLRTDEFNRRLRDANAQNFLRMMVLHHLDDVDQFFLGDPNSRPSEATWEAMWLDNAEMMLSFAEESFSKFESQVNRYGGPENVKMVG